MFTGIVGSRGTVRKARRRDGLVALEIDAPDVAKELEVGDSVAVNGICLTATATRRRRFSIQAMRETLDRSTLGDVARGSIVNLELPARIGDRLGGHLVQGHVDAVARVERVEDDGAARRVWVGVSESMLRYVVAKGSVALDGVSLTVVAVGPTGFEVALVPHTLAATTLGNVRVGERLNLEVDVLAKYVERLMER